MAITGRTALVAALGALLAPLGTVWLLAVVGLLAVGVAVDVALAGRIADLRMERSGGTSTRLGQPVEVALLVTNGGRRRVRGRAARRVAAVGRRRRRGPSRSTCRRASGAGW